MNQLDVLATGAAFDAIKQVDAQGEYWTGRDLMPVMEYSRWEDFAAMVEKAKSSLALIQGKEQADHHFGIFRSDGGRWGKTQLTNYRLTRFGAYLTAMAGDDTKTTIAAARIYFAVKTREAEVGVRRELSRRELAQMVIEEADRADQAEALANERGRQLALAAPKVEYVDAYVGPDDACTIRILANQLQVGEKALRQWLLDRKVVYRQVVGSRWSHSKQRHVTEYLYQPYSDHKAWFRVGDQPNAPRLHNDQMRTTLYVTALGKVEIRRLLVKHPIEAPAA